LIMRRPLSLRLALLKLLLASAALLQMARAASASVSADGDVEEEEEDEELPPNFCRACSQFVDEFSSTATTHSSPNPPHNMHMKRKQSTPHHTLPHTSACKPTLLRPRHHVLSPLLQTHAEHATCLALHCTALYLPNTRSHFTSAHQYDTCGPALLAALAALPLAPSQPHPAGPTQPAASWRVPSPTTYPSCVNDGTCRSASAIGAPPSGPMSLLLRLPSRVGFRAAHSVPTAYLPLHGNGCEGVRTRTFPDHR
jgi:hypothetical protein